jgi:hypothetical protein
MPKDKVINIRVSVEEYELLSRLAGKAGISKYMRDRALDVYTKPETVYTNDKDVYTKDKTVYTKPIANDKIVIQTKEAKRAALSRVTVQHSDTCQCFMCKGTF